jgi:general secretion pathway protein G
MRLEVTTFRRKRGSHLGFTFIEIVMVILLISILVGIAVPMYRAQVIASKESVLKHNLAMIRERLDQHKADRGVYPSSLEELVDKGYFREIPNDPFMESNEWEPIYEDYNPDEPEAELGIYDVMSYSSEIGLDGQSYSEW